MDPGTLLTELRSLFAKRNKLSSNDAGRRWVSRVTALIERARQIRDRAVVFSTPTSANTIRIAWSQALQIVADVIAKLEIDGYAAPGRSPGAGHIGPRRIFIGHGRSPEWRKLRDLITERLGLEHEEFNRESAAGLSNKERLSAMLDSSSFAFLVLTAEDEHADHASHARENVVHEVGLFQGRHGFERAIVLLEGDCAEFSNIVGLVHIPFPKGNILASSEDIRRVLEREGLIERQPSKPAMEPGVKKEHGSSRNR